MRNASTRSKSLALLSSRLEAFAFRAKALGATRRFFDRDGFIEVDTPIGVLAPAPEEYIEAPKAGSLFLRTSPELQMKRLLAAGMKRIYQIGPCFRMGESGRLHRPEFAMLEWYMAGSDYLELLAFTRGLLLSVSAELCDGSRIDFRGQSIDLGAEWCVMPVREAFSRFAGEDADKCAEDGRFELVLVDKVEPSLPKDRPTVLIDYPARFGAFARPKADDPTLCERWELYVGGVELANAYGELVDPAIQRARFEEFSKVRAAQGLAEYPSPVAFLEALDEGIPESSGCALGFDRFAMLLIGADCIDDVCHPLDS
jgi:elongation factor P--(R)-beta-lysine ligase